MTDPATDVSHIYDEELPFDWSQYLSGRPDYRQSHFYDRIWSYHQSQSNQWTNALDVACGPGNVAEVLATKFQTVHLSDTSRYALDAAQAGLADKSPATFTFQLSRAEELVEHYPSASTDFVIIAEAIGLTDIPTTLSTFATLLKPGGTLAILFYGIVNFVPSGSDPVESTHTSKLQSLFHRIYVESLSRIMPPEFAADPMTSVVKMVYHMDLPATEWEHVTRARWNYDLVDPKASSESAPKESANGTTEDVHDPTFWRKRVSFPWIKTHIDSLAPRPDDWTTYPGMPELLDEMQTLMSDGTGDGLHNITWPAVLLLATRK